MAKLSPPTSIMDHHQISEFDCGEASLNLWLKQRAIKNQISGASRCFVVCENKKVIGYYTLSAGAISIDSAPKKMRRNMPNQLPILLLGRLAIDKKYQGQGIGNSLLRDAMLRAIHVSQDAGIFAILIHALSDNAKKWYLSRGFVESPLQPMTLMMTLETIKSILTEAVVV